MFTNDLGEVSGAATMFSAAVGAIVRAFLAVTTAGFFYIYGGDIWSWVLPYPMANFAAAATGVILIDGMAYAWTYLRRTSADTQEQQTYAEKGAQMNMGLSLIITAVFVILTTDLLQASVAADTYATLVNLASWLGILVGVIAFAGNGKQWHHYDNASSKSVQQLRWNELRAYGLRMEHQLETERMKMHAGKTLADIRKALPQFTQQAASQSKDDYLASRFSQIETEQLAPTATPQPKREYKRPYRPTAVALSAESNPAPATLYQTGTVSKSGVTMADGIELSPEEEAKVRAARVNFMQARNGQSGQG